MTTVMCFGTFDLLHAGHRFLLTEAKRHGDALIVVVARDATVLQLKGSAPAQREAERLRNVQRVPAVDLAILGNPGDKLQVVITHKPDVLCLGYDQASFTKQLAEKLAAHGLHPHIIRIPAYAPEKYKTSKLRVNGQQSPS